MQLSSDIVCVKGRGRGRKKGFNFGGMFYFIGFYAPVQVNPKGQAGI